MNVGTITKEGLLKEVAELRAKVSSMAKLKGLPINLDLPQDITLFNDKRRNKQILINLLSNAIKFTEAGQISVKTTMKNRDTVVITVEDTGMGIKKNNLKKLFQPFQQISAELNKKSEGTGLGLYLSLKLARLMGGVISASSSYGKGSKFTVNLPIIYS